VSGSRTSTVRLRGRLTASWSAGGRGHRAAILLGGTITAALVGAFLFGAWHILFGGFVKGNWRAGGFGLALATVSGAVLGFEAAVARRLLSPARRP
jgi:membrane protease YdiL (CAAX protease family)